jgi:hypothetical protein
VVLGLAACLDIYLLRLADPSRPEPRRSEAVARQAAWDALAAGHAELAQRDAACDAARTAKGDARAARQGQRALAAAEARRDPELQRALQESHAGVARDPDATDDDDDEDDDDEDDDDDDDESEEEDKAESIGDGSGRRRQGGRRALASGPWAAVSEKDANARLMQLVPAAMHGKFPPAALPLESLRSRHGAKRFHGPYAVLPGPRYRVESDVHADCAAALFPHMRVRGAHGSGGRGGQRVRVKVGHGWVDERAAARVAQRFAICVERWEEGELPKAKSAGSTI